MKGKLRLQRALKSALDRKEDVTDTIPGLLGTIKNGKKRVKVTNRKGFVYVRLHGNLSETVQAYNDQVLQLYDMPVLVKRVHGKGYHYYVIGKDTGRYANWGGNNAQAQYAQHGNQHSFGIGAGGSDVVWVFKKQFMPLLLYPYSGTSIRIVDDWYQWGDVYKHFTGSVVDIGSAKPAIIGDARFVTLYIEGGSNTVKGVTGSLFTSTPFPADVSPYINIPTPSQGIPLSAVLLTSDTVNIAWNNIYDDIRPIYGVGGDSAFSTGTVGTVGQSLYLTSDLSDYTVPAITGSSNYKLLMADSDPRYEINRWFTASGTIIATFIDDYQSVGYINAGQWSADLSLNAPSAMSMTKPFVYVEMWKKKADGTETLISATPHNIWGGFSGENRYSFVGSITGSVIVESTSRLFIRVRAFHDGAIGEMTWLSVYVNKEANSTLNLPASPFYGGGHVFEWNGNAITQRGYANFVGAGVHAYDDGTNTVISIPGTVAVQQGGVYRGSGTTLNFNAGCSVAFTGSVAYINVTGTGMSIYDDEILKATSSAISFDAGLHVDVTGSTSFIQSIDTTLDDLNTHEPFLVIAHRGDINNTDGYPEDTIASILSAYWKSAHRSEIDVRQSSDGTWYAIHDDTVDRTTNGTGAVVSKTDAQMDALWIDGGYGYNITRHSGTYHPPTLQAILTALDPLDTTIQIENKTATNSRSIAELIVANNWQHRATIQVQSQAEAQDVNAVSPVIKVISHSSTIWSETDTISAQTGTYTEAQIAAYAPQQVIIYDSINNYTGSNQATLIRDAWDIGARGFNTWDLNVSVYEYQKFRYLDDHIADPNAHPGLGGGGGSISIYEGGSIKSTGTSGIDFHNGFGVIVSGTVAYITNSIVSGTSTYVRAGAPIPLTAITGAYWAIPDYVYATGTLSLFANGVAQSTTIDFTEQYAGSGTYKLESVHPTGTIFTAIWGVPVINTLNSPPYDARFVMGADNAGVPNGVLKNYLYDNYDIDAYPTSPSAWDDEFDGGGALDIKWTKVNDPAGADALNQTDYVGYLHVGLLELGTDNFDNAVRLYQTPPSGTTTWQFISKVNLSMYGMAAEVGEFCGVHLYLGNSTNDQFISSDLYFNDSVGAASTVYRRAGANMDNGAGGFTGVTGSVDVATISGQPIYLKIKKTTADAYTSANTYELYVSNSGILWDLVGIRSKAFTTACNEIGVMFRRPKSQTGTPKGEALVDFFRKV